MADFEFGIYMLIAALIIIVAGFLILLLLIHFGVIPNCNLSFNSTGFQGACKR